MREDANKRIILCLIILIILIILVLALLLINNTRNNNTENDNYLEAYEEGEDFLETYGKNEESKIDQQSYFDISSCIKQYLSIININNSAYYGYGESGEYEKIDDKSIKENIYKLLSKKYIDTNKITVDNLYKYVQVLNTSSLFVPLEMSIVQDAEIKSFLVHGIVESLQLEEISNIFILVNIDIINSRFSIYPINGEYSSIEDITNIQCDDSIEDNYINEFTQSKVNYETIAKDCLNRYKRLAIGKPEVIYNYLDKEYKDKRFGNIEEFKVYIKNNIKQISSMQCTKYYVEQQEGYTQYVIQDQYEKIYNFKVSSLLDFSIILDTYTLDLPEFIEKYKSASEQEKVGMNIEKVLEAINSKDYKYVYNKLDDTFKNNNFKTLNEFEKYIENNFYNYNDIKYLKFITKGEIYIYEVELKNSEDTSSKTKKLTIIMKLLEGTDFVMSFNIK